jgi:Glycosyl transferase family 2
MARSNGQTASPQAATGVLPGGDEPHPKVSVLLQTYNHERFIEQAIESVIDQETPFPIEVIVSDDCSGDATRALVSKQARAHPEVIKPLFPEHHLGMNPLFRRALGAARGDYLALLDGDDFWTSNDKLRKQVALLESEPGRTGCFHDALVVSEDDLWPARRYVPESKRPETFEVEDLVPLCYPPTLSVLFRREILAQVPDWVFDLAWADWLIWIFATRQGPFAYIDEVMGVYRVHEGGYFSSQDRSSQLEEDLRVYQRLLEELPEHSDLIQRCIAQRGCELAVEECGLPYDAPLVVVGEFHDLPLLFNGRTTKRLEPSAGEGGETSAAERLERLCREGAGPTMPLWRPRNAPREPGSRSCFVVVPKRHSRLEHHPGLAVVEREGSALWDDARCAIYELSGAVQGDGSSEEGTEAAAPALAEIVEVSSPTPPDERARGRVGRPAAGSVIDPSAVRLVGWALGHEGPVAGIEIESEGRVIWRGSVGAERPDLAEAFPDYGWARKAGFEEDADVLEAIGREGQFGLKVNAVLPDESRVCIASIRGRRRVGPG